MHRAGGSTTIRDETRSGATEREAQFVGLIGGQLEQNYRIARLMLRNDTDAEDATQDAIATAWQQWHRLRDLDRFDAWFGRILMNRCRDRLRKAARARGIAISRSNHVNSAELETARRLDIGRAFEALNADQRAVVVLRYWADLTVEQIAVRVGVAAGTVKSRLHHALERLRVVLDTTEEGP